MSNLPADFSIVRPILRLDEIGHNVMGFIKTLFDWCGATVEHVTEEKEVGPLRAFRED
jgi:hypothetical protein